MTARALLLLCWFGLTAVCSELPFPLALDGLRSLSENPATARLELQQSIARAKTEGNTTSEAFAMVGLALMSEKDGRHGEAEDILHSAATTSPDRAFLGNAARWMAARLSADAARAIAWFDVAAREFRALHTSKELARVLRSWAASMSQPSDRSRLLKEALPAAKEGGDVRDIAAIEGDLGDALRLMGDLEGAIARLKASATSLEELNDWAESARILGLLGRAYALHGRYGEAHAVLERSEVLYQKAGNPGGVMQVRAQRGLYFAVAGDRKRAIPILDQFCEYASAGDVPVGIKLRMASVAFAYLFLDEYAKAAEIAKDVSRQFPNRVPAPARWVLSAAYYHLGRYSEAVEEAARAVDRSGGSMFIQRQAYRWQAMSLAKLGKLDEAARQIRKAASFDNAVREQILAEDEWRRAFDDVRTPLAQDVVAILWSAGLHREALDAAESARARSFLDLMASRDAGATSSAPATSAQLSEYATRSGVPILSYWVHPEAVYVWLIGPKGGVRAFRTPIAAARLKGLVNRARSLSYKPDRTAWRELYKVLIQPVRPLLPQTPGHMLAVVPHGVLLQLPFNALMDPAGRYLAEDYVLREAPAAALLLRTEGSTKSRGRVLLVGDPVNPGNKSGMPFAPLPGARRELDLIASLAPGGNTMLQGRLALESRFRKEASGARVVHFATHAVIDSDQPFASFLALSGGDKLTAGEVYGLGLKADLVMLSACRSGSGKVSSDGLLGLTRAFLYAGAARVIAPLWDIPDEPTVLLVEEFYRRYLAGMSPGQALRVAQLKLLSDLRAGRVVVKTSAGPMTLPEHPGLWAGFVLQGGG